MGRKKQPELPGTRGPNEPPAPEPIEELDTLCAELEKRKGKVTKAGQDVIATKQQIDAALREHGRTSYLYETSTGVEKEVFIGEAIKTRKVKTEKAGDEE